MALPPDNNEPHRDDGPREERERPEHASPQPQLPKAETILRERFAQFSTEHALTALEAEVVDRTWRGLEQRIRGALIGNLIEADEKEVVFQPIAASVSEAGAVTFLVQSRDSRTSEYVVPTLVAPAFIEVNTSHPRYTLTNFHSHGVGMLFTIPNLDTETASLHLGLDYLLTPSAMQLDHDRFIARSTSSIIGSCLLSAIAGRYHRVPDIESITRWRSTEGETTSYRVLESDGTRHFIKTMASHPRFPSGITGLETVPPSMPSITLPRGDRLGGKVGLHFDEFHRQRGFSTIDPDSIVSEYPNVKEVVADLIKRSFPGFRSDWTVDFTRAVRHQTSTAILLGMSNQSLDSFVPGLTPESSIQDKAFSGLLVTMEVAPSEPVPDRSKKGLDWIRDKFPHLRPRPRPVMRLDIIGPVLSDDAWQKHISLLTSNPSASFFFPALARAISLDLKQHHDEPTQIEVTSIKPTRVTPDASRSWDTVVFAIDHTLGTHIVELVRERSFGLVPSLVPSVQQYFPTNRRQKH